MSGCPLAIIRINAMIATWIQVIKTHQLTLRCKASAFIDDKNLRSTSCNDFQQAIEVTKKFDCAVDAVVNTDKTVVFATTNAARQKLKILEFSQATDEKLHGASLSFSKKRSRHLADYRAKKYLTVAQRIAICPLNIAAKETLLATAGAPKYTYALEMGPCSVQTERKLRSTVCRALWSKSSHKSNDILFTICHKRSFIRSHAVEMVCNFQNGLSPAD